MVKLCQKNNHDASASRPCRAARAQNSLKGDADRYFDVGIAEDTASFSPRHATMGFHPVCRSIHFLQRAYDCIHHTSVAGSAGDFSHGPAGFPPTTARRHHGLFDIAYCAACPT